MCSLGERGGGRLHGLSGGGVDNKNNISRSSVKRVTPPFRVK